MNYHAVKAFIIDKLRNELSASLTYHGVHHTLDVLSTTQELCYLEQVGPYESLLLKTAALFHDSGFILDNQEHEKLGCQIAREHLPRFGFSTVEIQRVCSMIMATKIPQTPRNRLEEILCDADLDYLGRDDFYPIGNTLFEELRSFDLIQSQEDWNRLQVRFLENHRFFTNTNIRRRTRQKELHLEQLRKIVASYEKI